MNQQIVILLFVGLPLLAFSSTRTQHRQTCAIEDAGFEVRDLLVWLQAQGFPKGLNVSVALDASAGIKRRPDEPPVTAEALAWNGYDIALKPALEPICLARKPLDGSVVHNATAWGCGPLNIDGCRIGTSKPVPARVGGRAGGGWGMGKNDGTGSAYDPTTGRWPTGVMLDDGAVAALDGQAPGASRFFFTAKVSTAEREAGCEQLPARGGAATVGRKAGSAGLNNPRAGAGRSASETHNHHPTLKPIALTTYLARLLLPPPRETPRCILVPFAGTGSEMIGACLAGWDEVVGIECNAEYLTIAQARLAHWVDRQEARAALWVPRCCKGTSQAQQGQRCRPHEPRSLYPSAPVRMGA